MESTAGTIIRRARRRTGVTQQELARRLDTSQSLIARWESGAVSPSFDSVLRAVRATGLDISLVLYSYDYEHDAHIARNLSKTPLERLRSMMNFQQGMQVFLSKVTPVDG